MSFSYNVLFCTCYSETTSDKATWQNYAEVYLLKLSCCFYYKKMFSSTVLYKNKKFVTILSL